MTLLFRGRRLKPKHVAFGILAVPMVAVTCSLTLVLMAMALAFDYVVHDAPARLRRFICEAAPV